MTNLSIKTALAALLAGSLAATAGMPAFARADGGSVDPAKFQERIEKRVAGAWGTPVRREKREREDYQRVRVTGLNKAVWPDPPGYHERKQREEENALKVKSAERQRPRPHRKTEDGTKDSK